MKFYSTNNANVHVSFEEAVRQDAGVGAEEGEEVGEGGQCLFHSKMNLCQAASKS